jgi:hypothetical protein
LLPHAARLSGAAAPRRRRRARGKIQRVDPDFGSTLAVSNRDSQSNCWANLRILGQPCESQARDRRHVATWMQHSSSTVPVVVPVVVQCPLSSARRGGGWGSQRQSGVYRARAPRGRAGGGALFVSASFQGPRRSHAPALLLARTRTVVTWRSEGKAVHSVDLWRSSDSLSHCPGGGVTHPAPSKYHDEIIAFVFIHTKYGEPIVIMVFRRAIQKGLCLTPPPCPGPEAAVSGRQAPCPPTETRRAEPGCGGNAPKGAQTPRGAGPDGAEVRAVVARLTAVAPLPGQVRRPRPCAPRLGLYPIITLENRYLRKPGIKWLRCTEK